MIDEMYNVMARINEIRNRFGLSKKKEVEIPSENKVSGQSFQQMTDNAISTMKGELNIDNDAELTQKEINRIADYYASKKNIPAGLVRSIIKAESNYNVDALSPKGAMGLMQLMPETAMGMGIENPFNPEQNIKGGVTLLKGLLDDYHGDYKLALAAYNAGKGNVERAGGVPDFRETKDYVKKVIDFYVSDEGKISK
ncbi:MAG TPA: lytic transglycosylase domain-containing protein [Spirochaetota bacterium]|nr:lytic transglycosylase domain-containing protein [Spirochaetota bacterium]HPJ33596.1 lytic transglycosylase domain-containing protein [Spirochaetota bacterium]